MHGATINIMIYFDGILTHSFWTR